MMNPFPTAARFVSRFAGAEGASDFVSSGAPSHTNADWGKKLRDDEWLISTIVLEINRLEGTS